MTDPDKLRAIRRKTLGHVIRWQLREIFGSVDLDDTAARARRRKREQRERDLNKSRLPSAK